jgi:hypothetical protein
MEKTSLVGLEQVVAESGSGKLGRLSNRVMPHAGSAAAISRENGAEIVSAPFVASLDLKRR